MGATVTAVAAAAAAAAAVAAAAAAAVTKTAKCPYVKKNPPVHYPKYRQCAALTASQDPKDITKPDWWQQKGPKECPTSYYSRCVEMLEEHDADCTRCRKQDQFKHTLRMLCGYSAPATQIRSCQEHQAWSQ